MGIGDYICVTLRGGAPWGFTLREGEGDTYRPLIVTQVQEDGRAFLAGVRDDDEAVSLNGEPCADLTLLQALKLIDTSIDCLQLLVKRYSAIPSDDDESEETSCSERDSSGEVLESTTLHIVSSKYKDLHISESQDDAYNVELDIEFPNRPQLLCTELHTPSYGDQKGQDENDEGTRRCLSPGDMVELQVSLSEQTLDDFGCASLGCALGIEGGLSKREAIFTIPTTTTTSHDVPSSVREPLGQRGLVLSSPSMLGQVEVILQKQPTASVAGRSILNVGGSVGSQSEGEEGGGLCEEVPGSYSVSFGIPSEEGLAAEEQDSDSEGDQDKPNKHRAKHARLRRGESQSEKQLKEAKSKCKRIALLLTAAPPNPNNKGVLMFKKHRQRAKKYTLVSYGTGEDEPDYSDEEDEENEDQQGTHTVELTLLAPNKSEQDKQLLANAQSEKGVLTINLDKGLLEIERSLNNQAGMDSLPETKGKGALMFAQRRMRMDEISAEHEQLRSQGIPVEGVVEAEKKIAEHSYMQSTTEGHAYMDVNIHQQSQQQQYQQYQEQQYYEQQQSYQQQQQQYQQQQQQYQQQYQQQQQYEQQHYQQQMYQQQQQEYHQEQQQMQHYSTNINGSVQHQTTEMQSSFNNRTAKPFSAENMVTATYSPAMSGTNQDSMGQGEQIASRDERISTPAIRSGLLMDARKRNVGKPMFTFKEAPKVSPNPALLNLLNRGDRKPGFESGPEEDYLSLGAEACNFLQPSRGKPKIPPPVAPKPVINPNSPPWSPQLEVTNQDMPQQAENSVSTPAVAPTAETTLGPEPEPAPAPAPEPSPPPAPQEAPVSTTVEEQPTWTQQPESQQQPLQVSIKEENSYISSTQQQLQQQPEHAPVTGWSAAQVQVPQQPPTNSWHPSQVQPQEPPPSQSPPQPPWVTRQPPQIQAQVQPPTSNWTPPIQPSWSQPQEQPHPQQQYQPPWTQPQEHLNQQQMQPAWGQDQTRQQPQPPWAQPSQTESQHQPPWMTQQQQQPQQQPQQQSQPPWVQQVQPESQPQPQPPWAQQPQHQAPHQAWPQAQAPGQPQPPWVTAQPQQQQQQQPSMNTWPPSQTQPQVQPPWVQAGQSQPSAQPQANLNPWAPVPAQPEPQPSWAQQPPEHAQPPMNPWAQDQNPAQHQPPWAQPVPPQPAPQSNWQQSPSRTPPQQMNAWPPAQTQPQTPANTWAPQAQQTPVSALSSVLNPRPSPKPWNPPQSSPQSRTPPPPPQRMHSFTIGQRVSSPINPMATVLNPSSQGSALKMPAVKGKGADMFAKRQSRMEKFVVDSETVQANKAIRSSSPVASLPSEWKYTPNVRAPPSRSYNPMQSPSYPPAATKQPPPGSPSTKAKKKEAKKPTPAPKPLNVVDVMKHQPYQLDSSLFLFGPAAEAAKQAAAAAKAECPPPNPPVENQPIQYEQMAPVQQAGPYNAPYPQQGYGMPMQPMMHDGHYQQNPNAYPPPNPYQQPPGVQYQQAYNQQYQQPAPPPYQPQSPQSPNAPYQQAAYQQANISPYQQVPQAPYQPANSPPYLAAPPVPYQPQPPSSYTTPSFTVAARPDSASGAAPVAAPKPKFTAKKSSAQVWKPTAVEKE